MKLISLLDKNFINPGARVRTKEAAIDLVLKQFFHVHKFHQSMEEIRAAILAREELGGTLLGNGLAIPHARLDQFDDLLVGIVIPETPIRSEAGEELRCIVVFLTLKAGTSVYLQTLASFARIGQDPVLYPALLACRSPSEVIQTLGNVYVEQGMTVKDIMSPNLYTVQPHSSLKDLADLFYKYHISYAPVVSDEQDLLGEVDVIDLLKAGIPEYAAMIGNLDFLSQLKPFEELLNNEDTIPVRDIMRAAKLTLQLDTSLIRTAMLMTTHKRRHIPVVEEGRVLGIVSFMDLLSKVLRA